MADKFPMLLRKNEAGGSVAQACRARRCAREALAWPLCVRSGVSPPRHCKFATMFVWFCVLSLCLCVCSVVEVLRSVLTSLPDFVNVHKLL